jgi:hypothetical protein
VSVSTPALSVIAAFATAPNSDRPFFHSASDAPMPYGSAPFINGASGASFLRGAGATLPYGASAALPYDTAGTHLPHCVGATYPHVGPHQAPFRPQQARLLSLVP